MNLKENERIDDLGCNNLKIIQNKNWFCFGIDSVLLVNFAKNMKENSIVLDLGTGTGIMPILLSGKINMKKAIGIEIQENVAEMAKRSVELNNLQDKIEIICSNILNLDNTFFNKKGLENKFDVIITNPPYKKKGEGKPPQQKNNFFLAHCQYRKRKKGYYGYYHYSGLHWRYDCRCRDYCNDFKKMEERGKMIWQ